MASMSGAARSPSAVPDPRLPPTPEDDDELFTGLVVSNPQTGPRGLWMPASVVGHVLIAALVVLVPIFWPSESPDLGDPYRVLIYNPPPPPPPPLPKGTAAIEKPQAAKPVTPDPKPEKPKLEVEIPKETPLKPEAKEPESEQKGSEHGSDLGDPAGMDIGQEGGVVGGVPGGVLGGVVGGTGDGPVMDYDQPPRPIKITKPVYPQEAFVKKIEGTVVLEILIDMNGRVIRARVLQPIPALDAAAIQCVQQWVFSPAIKRGRPVATIAQAPVNFRIF
jgi:periplasmic protein TonB